MKEDKTSLLLTSRIRPITEIDNTAVAKLIRSVMTEYGANQEGFAIKDPEVDDMCASYSVEKAKYFVLDVRGEIKGGAGIGPLAGGTQDTCELRKMYLYPEVRGLGLGAKLLDECLVQAKAFGYEKCYLETFGPMKEAQALYRNFGFQQLNSPMGSTGHFRCNIWYLKDPL
ncbi:MAG: GNAT family N-acetyltransferase [Oligoflexales bacterium]